MDEKIDILDERGNPTGETVWKSAAHRQGLLHRSFHCWVCSPKGEYLFVQRRAPDKELWPGMLDVTAAGHLQAGEEVMDGLREVEEELGLIVDPRKLIPLGTRRSLTRERDATNREFQEVYLLPEATPPEDYRLQEEEVAAILRLEPASADRLFEGEAVAAEELQAGEWKHVQVGPRDFIAIEDGYLLRVARAVRALADGRSPHPIF